MATTLTSRFDEALAFTMQLHRKQERKGSRVPYVGHLLGTAGIVLHFGGDEDQAIAGLLHDAPEDQGGRPTLARIADRFGDRVAGIVEACTDTFEDPKPAWRARKEAYIARIRTEPAHVRLVSAADKLDNARAILADLRVHGDALWRRFTGGAESVWYYRELVKAFQAAGGGALVDELAAVVAEIERGAGRG